MTRRTRPDPLEPSERALAEALARAAPPSGPSPGLDATILAAARGTAAGRAGAVDPAGQGVGAGATPPSSTGVGHRRRRRNPAWLRGGALAATVVLAVGVAWQLRPQFDMTGLGDEAPLAMESPAPAGDRAEAPVSARMLREPAAAASPSSAEQTAPSTERAAVRPQAIERVASPSTDAPARAADVIVDQPGREPTAAREAAAAPADHAMSKGAATPARPAPADASTDQPTGFAPAPAPPPAPPAPPAPAPLRLLQALPPREPAPVPEAAARARSADARAGAQPVDAEAMHDEDWLDQPLDDTPPASVDSPAVREAWLARIRELVASERYEEARESFAEFRRRHPGAAVPDDLRALLGKE